MSVSLVGPKVMDVEFGINRETLQFIIDEARLFQTSAPATDTSIDASVVVKDTELAEPDQARAPEDPARTSFHAVIEDLGADQRVALVALMWCGRGDFELSSQWQEAMDAALAAANSRTADYLIESPLLADYLEEGLAQLEMAGL